MVMFMVVAVLCISAAFFFAAGLVQHEDDFIEKILQIYLGFWVLLPVLVILIQLVRFLWWVIRFICCGCGRRPRSTPRLLPLALPPVRWRRGGPMARTDVLNGNTVSNVISRIKLSHVDHFKKISIVCVILLFTESSLALNGPNVRL